VETTSHDLNHAISKRGSPVLHRPEDLYCGSEEVLGALRPAGYTLAVTQYCIAISTPLPDQTAAAQAPHPRTLPRPGYASQWHMNFYLPRTDRITPFGYDTESPQISSTTAWFPKGTVIYLSNPPMVSRISTLIHARVLKPFVDSGWCEYPDLADMAGEALFDIGM